MTVSRVTCNLVLPSRSGRIAIGVLAAWLAAAVFILPVAAQVAWSSSFEAGFPGEWQNYDSGGYSPTGAMPTGRTSAWAIVGAENGVTPRHSTRMYKGWITGTHSDSHRAYPGVVYDIPTPLINTFYVYVDLDYARMSSSDWVQLGTWGNNQAWALHTMSVRDRKLEFAHTNPFSGEYIGSGPQPNFPLRQWVRFTVYVHYQGSTGFVQVWQDGVPMLRAQVAQLQQFPGTNLQTSHWGMYASATMSHGVQYNDQIEICRLPQPLTDLVAEPTCNQNARPNPPANLRVD